jgi:hypothetical protein
MDNSWIKLNRKLRYKGFYQKSQYVHLWIHLLLSANHREQEFMWNKGVIKVKEGQLIAGRKKLSDDTGIPESTCEDILNFFETEDQIRQQKTPKFRLITILKWKSYQEKQQQSNNRPTTEKGTFSSKLEKTRQQKMSNEVDNIKLVSESSEKSNNKATTKQQQTDTNKNGKNGKKELYIAEQDSAEKSTFNHLGAKIIQSFSVFNPACKRYYANKTQRTACDLLIDEYGIDEVLKVIAVLPKTNKTPYLPKINTPLQLWEQYQSLKDGVYKKKMESINSNKGLV